MTSMFGVLPAHTRGRRNDFKDHSLLKQKGLNIITIIIPRHINRSPKILAICNYVKLKSQIIKSHSEI